MRDDYGWTRAVLEEWADDFGDRLTGLCDGLYLEKKKMEESRMTPKVRIQMFRWMFTEIESPSNHRLQGEIKSSAWDRLI